MVPSYIQCSLQPSHTHGKLNGFRRFPTSSRGNGWVPQRNIGGSEITCPVCVWIEDAYEIHRFGQCLCFGWVPLANIRMPAETLGCLFKMVSRSVDVLNTRALDGPHPNMRLPALMSRPLLVCGSKKTC